MVPKNALHLGDVRYELEPRGRQVESAPRSWIWGRRGGFFVDSEPRPARGLFVCVGARRNEGAPDGRGLRIAEQIAGQEDTPGTPIDGEPADAVRRMRAAAVERVLAAKRQEALLEHRDSYALFELEPRNVGRVAAQEAMALLGDAAAAAIVAAALGHWIVGREWRAPGPSSRGPVPRSGGLRALRRRGRSARRAESSHDIDCRRDPKSCV